MAQFQDSFRPSVNNMASVAYRFVPNWGQNDHTFGNAFLASAPLSNWI